MNTTNVPFEAQTEMTTESGQTLDDLHCSNTFVISDGVRRAKAAEQLGLKSIEAMDHTGKTFQVQIENLRSPLKKSIDISTTLKLNRYEKIFNGFKSGDKIPPIYVNPGNRGVKIIDIKFIH